MCKTPVCSRCTNILSNFKKVCRNCSFLKCYVDRRGIIYFVKQGINSSKFKTYYIKPGDNRHYDYDKHLPQFSFAEAQSALNQTARERKWDFYDGASPADWSEVV